MSKGKRSYEYWQNEYPEWTVEQCKAKAEWFKRCSNYQCIEYYEKKYPNLSNEERLKIKEENIRNKKSNHPLNIEYYQKRYPDLSPEEQRQKQREYALTKSWCSPEYYISKGYSEEEANQIAKEKSQKAGERLSESLKGENNPMHKSKTSQEYRNSMSPRNIAFYERKYPNSSHEEHVQLRNEFLEKNRLAVKNAIKNTNIEYYLNQGMSMEDAKKALHDRQSTFSLEKCIAKYGEEKGLEVFEERQTKWYNSLSKTFNKNGKAESPLAIKLFDKITQKLGIKYVKQQSVKNIFSKYSFFFDFCYGNKLIEFNGDYWHANPTKYKADDFINAKKEYAKDIWDHDQKKIDSAIAQGYDVLVIWESEYNNNPDKTLQKCIDFLSDKNTCL